MVTQITLGTYGVQDGKNVLTGGASQIDTKGLIDALATAKRAPAVRLETADKTIDAQTTSLNKLKTLLATFETAADTLRNASGVDNDSKNIFKYRTSTLSNNDGTAANFVSVTVQPGANIQNYTIDSITQLAQQTKQQTNTFSLADDTTASAVASGGSAFKPGTFNLRAIDGTASGIAVTLTSGDSLQTVASKFNAVSSQTGIQATVLNVAPGSYKLIYSATNTGTAYGFDLGNSSGVMSDPSGALSGVTFTTNQTAQDSIFSIDGVSITRSTNSISDALTGVTFNLKQALPAASNKPILVDISPDTTLVANAITQLADAYNAFKLFASTQSQVDANSAPKDTAVLYNDVTMRNLISDVSAEVTNIISGITGTTTTSGGTPAQPAQTVVSGNNSGGTAIIGPVTTTSAAVTGTHTLTVQQIATSSQVAIYTLDNFTYYTSFNDNSVTTLPGVSFNLLNVSGGQTVNLNVTAAVASSGGVTTTTAPIDQLSDVGLTLDNFAGDDTNPATKNIITVDTDKLNSVLASNFDAVAKLFEYQQTSDNSSFATFKTSNNLSATSYQIALTLNSDSSTSTTTQTATATYTDGSGTHTVNLDVTPISGGGYTLKGQANTIFDGTQFVAGSNVAAGVTGTVAGTVTTQQVTINVKQTQGYGDRFYNLLDRYTNSTDGAVTQDLSSLADTKSRNTTEISAIDDKIATYRDQLVTQYANLESSITQANNILQLLDAQSKAANNSGG